MLQLSFATSVLIWFSIMSSQHSPPMRPLLAAKCTGQDPCPACSNCTECKFCRNGKTCGACKPHKKLLAINMCE